MHAWKAILEKQLDRYYWYDYRAVSWCVRAYTHTHTHTAGNGPRNKGILNRRSVFIESDSKTKRVKLLLPTCAL